MQCHVNEQLEVTMNQSAVWVVITILLAIIAVQCFVLINFISLAEDLTRKYKKRTVKWSDFFNKIE